MTNYVLCYRNDFDELNVFSLVDEMVKTPRLISQSIHRIPSDSPEQYYKRN